MSTFEELHQNQILKKRNFSQKLRHFWLKYKEKIILAVGIILIALISFEAGFLKGQKNQKEPIEINQAVCSPCPKTNQISNENESKTNIVTNNVKPAAINENNNSAPIENQKCAFVASKNSNKYHLPTCQFAQKIKPENKICFSSKEEAERQGYQGAKCCIK